MTWDGIGRGSLKAAQRMKTEGHWRSSVSRSYYAAFSVLAERLIPHITLPVGYTAPPHQNMSGYIRRHLADLYPKENRSLRATVTRLYNARLDADYNPAASHDERVALNALRDARTVFAILEVDDG